MVHNQVESSTLKNRNISLQYQEEKKHKNLPGLSSSGNNNPNAKCSTSSSSSQFPSAAQSSTKTYHLILCEQIVKEVIISETEITRTGGDPLGVQQTNAIPLYSHQRQQPQISFSSGTLPRCSSAATSSSSSSVPPTQQQLQSEPQTSSSSTSSALLTPEYIKTFQNKKLTKHLAWKDERRAVSFLFIIITIFFFSVLDTPKQMHPNKYYCLTTAQHTLLFHGFRFLFCL